jgi:hypothetical protein
MANVNFVEDLTPGSSMLLLKIGARTKWLVARVNQKKLKDKPIISASLQFPA